MATSFLSLSSIASCSTLKVSIIILFTRLIKLMLQVVNMHRLIKLMAHDINKYIAKNLSEIDVAVVNLLFGESRVMFEILKFL
jgi:hypothetical protein